MGRAVRLVWTFGKFVFATLVGAVGIEICHQFKWYPEQDLTALVMSAPGHLTLTLAYWIAAAIIGVILLFAEHWGGPLLRRFISGKTKAVPKTPSTNSAELDFYPNVRVADNPALIELFTVPSVERNKLLALLNDEKIRSWARSMARTNSDLEKLSGTDWRRKLTFDPAASDKHINQTFLKNQVERPWMTAPAIFYDVWLNFSELKKIWPDLSVEKAEKETR